MIGIYAKFKMQNLQFFIFLTCYLAIYIFLEQFLFSRARLNLGRQDSYALET